MSSFPRLLAPIILTLLLGACSSTMKAVKPDASGAFPTKDQLKPAEVIVNERFDLEPYRHLVYVQVGEKSELYETFIVGKVLTKSGFEQELIASGKSDDVSNISDLIGLRGASKAYGPFLVVSTDVEWVGGYDFTASIKAIDPMTGRTLYHAKRKAFNWAGLDKPLFYPLFNGFLGWVNANKAGGAPASSP
jgi:hypothetical protein